jgi:hypothetical protein
MSIKAEVVFHGVKEASLYTGISKAILDRAKLHPKSPKGLTGFHPSGRIYWNITDNKGVTLEQWMTDNKKELEHVKPGTLEHWQLLRLKYQTLALEAKLEEKRRKVVNKADVLETFERIAEAFKECMNTRLRTPMIEQFKLNPDQIAYLDTLLAEIIGVFDKQIEEWNK